MFRKAKLLLVAAGRVVATTQQSEKLARASYSASGPSLSSPHAGSGCQGSGRASYVLLRVPATRHAGSLTSAGDRPGDIAVQCARPPRECVCAPRLHRVRWMDPTPWTRRRYRYYALWLRCPVQTTADENPASASPASAQASQHVEPSADGLSRAQVRERGQGGIRGQDRQAQAQERRWVSLLYIIPLNLPRILDIERHFLPSEGPMLFVMYYLQI